MPYYGAASAAAVFISSACSYLRSALVLFCLPYPFFYGICFTFTGLFLTILSYFTPIMYDISMLDPIIQKVLKLNPLYHYITFARTIILYDQVPSLRSFVICGASCLIVFIAGVIIFKKNQDKFIYYM